jgi:DNA-binding CsgD family transcriptional regulator
MGAHGNGSTERNRQPTILDNSVLASGLVSGGLRGGARCRVFTPSAINIIRELAGQGKSASEIAEVIGSTTGSVRVKCSQLKIKIKLRRQGQQGHIRQIAGQRLVICLSDAIYAALKRKAADMQKSAVELSGELLDAIISSDIYEAVLDDDKLT